jgi:nucleoid DNA-binding protein
LKKRIAELKKNTCKRLADIDDKVISKCIDALIKIIRDRIFDYKPTIIDNFGTISVKNMKPRKLFNVVTREWMDVETVAIYLIPNIIFAEYIRDPEYLKLFKKKIVEKAKKDLIVSKGRRLI